METRKKNWKRLPCSQRKSNWVPPAYVLRTFLFCSLLSGLYLCVQWQILIFYMNRFSSHSCSEILPFWIWKVKTPGSHLNRPSSAVSLLHHVSIIRGPGISLASDSLMWRFRVPYLFEVPEDEPRWLRWFRVHMGISSLSFAKSLIWTVTMKTWLLLEHRLTYLLTYLFHGEESFLRS